MHAQSDDQTEAGKNSISNEYAGHTSKCASLALKTRPGLDSTSERASATTNRK